MRDLDDEIEDTVGWNFFAFALAGFAAVIILVALVHYNFLFMIIAGLTTSFFAGAQGAVEGRHRSSKFQFLRSHRILYALYRFSLSFAFWIALCFIF